MSTILSYITQKGLSKVFKVAEQAFEQDITNVKSSTGYQILVIKLNNLFSVKQNTHILFAYLNIIVNLKKIFKEKQYVKKTDIYPKGIKLPILSKMPMTKKTY